MNKQGIDFDSVPKNQSHKSKNYFPGCIAFLFNCFFVKPVQQFPIRTTVHYPQQDYPFFNACRMERDVSLNWMFNNPILVVFFHVERSSDGVNFIPIAEITSTSSFFFRYHDRTVTLETFSYRIVAYQHDGAVLYSRTDIIHIGRRS